MKRFLLWSGVVIGAAAIGVLIYLIRSTCVFGNHVFTPATCTEPMVCTRCGEQEGEPLGHVFGEATCTEPSVCLRCGEHHADPLGHEWLPATCTEPETCARCGITNGEPLGHVMTDPNFQVRSTCTRCGYTAGDPLTPALTGRTFRELQIGEPAPYTTASYEDRDVDVTGSAEITDYRVIDGDETFPARGGYEWHIATIRLVFDGEDAQSHGAQSAYTFGDYYILDNAVAGREGEDGMRTFAADWYGMRVQCWQKTGATLENDWVDRELHFTWEEGVLVPKGYDGVLLILYHFGKAADATRLYLPASEVLDEDALVFRMK